ncbi:MAG: phage Gp37/Gp68 family protein [Candidatus Eremiobacteraeota bacterium]|nr:phage Gp37/Gp68 family protein [Candidatus Eremiobacteraeota bacterium]
MAHTKIEWTQMTWNPVTGCTKISEGCRNCYAERMAKRLHLMGQRNYQNEFKITMHEHMLNLPYHWKKTQHVFVNSMSDLFHEDIPYEYIKNVFATMESTPWHRYQLLTKRSERLSRLDSQIKWPSNVWMGVSVESDAYSFRIDHLRKTGALLKFISFEPLIGPIDNIDLSGIDWVIVGGESGPGARPMAKQWVIKIRDKCEEMSIPFFFKQWGGTQKSKTGRLLEGKIWDEYP